MKPAHYLLSLGLLLFGCRGTEQPQGEAAELPRPNIIFIMTDDHAMQAISAYGHPISQLAPTPNLDRIAREGVLFRNNFCTNSICGPSRGSDSDGQA
ncbi:sulfatase-like hydrolase/transferase [Cesiribacter andamanensis]|nr:sulfatase-like hydrolase/transferase [Cesiribacter andamanensis]